VPSLKRLALLAMLSLPTPEKTASVHALAAANEQLAGIVLASNRMGHHVLQEFVNYLVLGGVDESKDAEPGDDAVTLSTVHAAKGTPLCPSTAEAVALTAICPCLHAEAPAQRPRPLAAQQQTSARSAKCAWSWTA